MKAAASVRHAYLIVRMEIAVGVHNQRHGGRGIERGKSGQILVPVYTWRLEEDGVDARTGCAPNHLWYFRRIYQDRLDKLGQSRATDLGWGT